MELHSTDNSERILNDLKDRFGSRGVGGPILNSGGGDEDHIYYQIDLTTLGQ